MFHAESDYESHMERLTRAAVNGNEAALGALSTRELRLVFASRAAWARLMLGLAIKLDAGVVPTVPNRAG